jgi:mRNA-degrading endonuclease toxin of MazEF toxin-antitoxin module
MRLRLVAALAIVLCLGIGTASAATTPFERNLQKQLTALKKQNTSLQNQITALKKQNTTLSKRIATLNSNLNDGVGTALVVSGCVAAITADAFQSTWTVVNQATGKGAFGSTQNVADPGVCTALKILREPSTLPPTIAPFNALLALFTGRLLPSFGP